MSEESSSGLLAKIASLVLTALLGAVGYVFLAHRRASRIRALLTELAKSIREPETTAQQVFETTDAKRQRWQSDVKSIIADVEKESGPVVRLNIRTRKKLEALFDDVRVHINPLAALGYNAESVKNLSNEDVAARVERIRDGINARNFLFE